MIADVLCDPDLTLLSRSAHILYQRKNHVVHPVARNNLHCLPLLLPIFLQCILLMCAACTVRNGKTLKGTICSLFASGKLPLIHSDKFLMGRGPWRQTKIVSYLRFPMENKYGTRHDRWHLYHVSYHFLPTTTKSKKSWTCCQWNTGLLA